jgi:WD40 repeat protein
LGAEGGVIQRDVFVRYFSLLIARFKIAEVIHPFRGDQQAPGLFSPPAKEVKPLPGAAFAAGAFETSVADKKLRGHPPVIDPTFRWAAVFDPKGIQVLDLASGKVVGGVKQTDLSAIAFSADGTRLATGSNDARARVWNWKTGELIAETPKQAAGWSVSSLAFSPNGEQLLGVGGPREVHLWDVPSGKVRHVLKGNPNTPHRVAFSPDGKTMLACDLAKKSGTLAVWDATSGKLLATERSADTVLLGAVFSPDSKRFVTVGGNGTIRLWDTATCDPIGVERLATNPDNGRFILNNITTAHSAAFSADGKYLAVAYEDGAIAFWDAATMRDMTIFQAHPPDTLRTVCFSPDGARLASTATDGSVRFWDVRKLIEAEREGDDR